MLRFFLTLLLFTGISLTGSAQIVDKQQLLDAHTFWDNRDWDWYIDNIPFLDTPDQEINATYYYRWEVVTKHLTYGSPKSGYSYTEFIDRPFWSGAYGAISCPAGHQLYEVRWLRKKRFAQDYARYWFRTPGAQPRRYSTWLADSVWAVKLVQGDTSFAVDLLPDLKDNFAGWQERHFVPEVGLFWQTGHDDGMEFNINSRQTGDILRGAPSYRPSFNAYMYADAIAIANIARLAGDDDTAARFEATAAKIRQLVQDKLWDSSRQFFFPMFKNREEKDGDVIEPLTLTYETGKHAGNPHGRELIGYVPWQFNLPASGKGYEQAWRFLMDPDYFAAPYGPTVTERNDPLFLVTDHCCWWSGQSWPYATTQTLVAMANLLNNYEQDVVTPDDYFELLKTYTMTHRKDGRPYIAEGANPDTGSWQGYDNFNHSEHYFHSGYCDLIISGLIGLRPRADAIVEINPLVPASWSHFALVDVPYKGRLLSIVWDRSGQRYGHGAGLHLILDGQKLASRSALGKLTASLPELSVTSVKPTAVYNFAVNNDGNYFPKMEASYSSAGSSPMAAQDGVFWYHLSPPNRWTTVGSPNKSDWITVDFGTNREIHEVVLYPLDDATTIQAPQSIELHYLDGDTWKPLTTGRRDPATPTGHRANHIRFAPIRSRAFRAVLTHAPGRVSGLSELEAWGRKGAGDLDPPPRPPSLSTNASGQGFPRVTASHTSRYDQVEFANDGKINYRPNPHNRWTAYESTSEQDWLQVDFGKATTVGRVELHLYDDRGGVQPPNSYSVEYLSGENSWRPVEHARKDPAKPVGSTVNTVTFDPITTTKVRVVFNHSGASRSGLTEIDCWEK